MVVAMSLQQAGGIYIYNTRFKKNWPIQKEIVFPNPQLPQYALPHFPSIFNADTQSHIGNVLLRR
ncbi:hypothetical protein T4E_8149 [Trichinella pseudospiralis]|uniref:Uncharacterized protein n=1 Tax=Trichinella pseudospiralis TaxID=6337 RepID=A0A0V0XK80_TRIPS|nr:hypothetical protein T4E_8149 [Trichinella pseudospiralis]